MKAKILLLTALAAAIVYSCSTERDEEQPAPVQQKVEKTDKVELEALKTNSNNQEETSRVSDSIDAPSHQTIIDPSTGLDPLPTNPDPNDPEIIPPGDVRPPKGK